MRIAVLVKQIPQPEAMTMRDGRLVRDGIELEVNSYCRRANAKAVELAGESGEVVVFTMGPPAADDALREMIACGAHRGVHLCDGAFAGADTLATARALALAVFAEGPFDLVLSGLNSLDGDTGQVGPEVAELLGLPFAPGARELTIVDGVVHARLETDSGYRDVELELPAAVSTAERLCDPSKADPVRRASIAAERIVRRTARDFDLKPAEVGAAGSPTSVGPVRVHATTRRAVVAATPAEAVAIVDELGAWSDAAATSPPIPATGGSGPEVWCFLEPDRRRPDRELVAAAADLAAQLDGSVTAVAPRPLPPDLGAQGADRVLVISGEEPELWADAVAEAAGSSAPWALLVEGTRLGRSIAATVAARRGWGLTGDAIELDISPHGRLRAWKPAFGGRLVAPIESSSPVQLVTVRPGVLRGGRRRSDSEATVFEFAGRANRSPRVRTVAVEHTDTEFTRVAEAGALIGVGRGVAPDDYGALASLQDALGAPLVGTRKVTDQGWLPRSRQIGITGRSVAPRLFVSIGASGRFNHVVGFVAAKAVLAINAAPDAEIFEHADVGLVGDWHDLVPGLVAALNTRSAEVRERVDA